ncbi:MAG TPA: hypothetical protein VE218_06550 [Acidobacteriaceae bacterium]|nr:hypothetical protein [Acidobacteriaceae bacterium]
MRRVIVALVLLGAAAAAYADGGRLQMRQAAGPFVVSLFTTPESLAMGPADLSVMVEDQGSGSVLLDADVAVTLTSEDARVAPVMAHLSHVHATNRLLQDAVVQLPHAGRWHAAIHVSEAGREASATTVLMVANYSARRGTVWLFAVLPICAIALFAWVEVAKRRARRRRALSRA